MDSCIICFESNNDVSSRITTQSSEWSKQHIQAVIEKHLWWWYLIPPSNGKVRWICCKCWQEISSFHDFYVKVELMHKQYHKIISHVGEVKKSSTKIKDETVDSSVALTTNFKSREIVEINNTFFDNECEANETICLEPLHIKEELDCYVEDNYNNDSIDIGYENKVDMTYEKVVLTNNISRPLANFEINAEKSKAKPVDCLRVAKRRRRGRPRKQDKIERSFEARELDMVEVNCELIFQTNEREDDEEDNNEYGEDSLNNDLNIRTDANVGNEFDTERIIRKMPKKRRNIFESDVFFKEIQFKMECSLCNVIMRDFATLLSHFRREHHISGYATCCGRKYYRRCLLADHLSVHQDPNFFKCKLCAKRFIARRGLEIHMESHTSLKPSYSCKVCGKSFMKREKLRLHKLTHIKNDKIFSCSQCNRKYHSEYLRQKHENYFHAREHDEACKSCGKIFSKTFNKKSYLKRHLEYCSRQKILKKKNT